MILRKTGLVAATLLLALLSANAYAWDCASSHGGFRTTGSDSWTGNDKLEHFGVSVPFGAIGAYVTRDTDHPVIYGTLLGTVPGLAKEVMDGTCKSNGFSYKDLTADLLGSLTGAALGNVSIQYFRDRHGATVAAQYHQSFE